MRRERLVTSLEVPINDPSVTGRADFWSAVFERMTHMADEAAHEAGGSRVRTVAPVISHPQMAEHALTGQDTMLVVAEWTIDVPDSFDPGSQRIV
jgi:hypothetical protein